MSLDGLTDRLTETRNILIYIYIHVSRYTTINQSLLHFVHLHYTSHLCNKDKVNKQEIRQEKQNIKYIIQCNNNT